MQKRALGAVLVATAALIVAGCGSNSSSDVTPTDEWADGLCSSITTWTSSLSSIADSLKGGGVPTKESLSSAVDDAKAATSDFTSSLGDLGKPDTEAGQQAKDSVDQLSTQIDEDIAAIEDAVDGATGVSGIVNAVQVISATVSKAGSQVTDTLTSFQDLDAKGELESAFKDAPACQKLTGGS